MTKIIATMFPRQRQNGQIIMDTTDTHELLLTESTLDEKVTRHFTRHITNTQHLSKSTL